MELLVFLLVFILILGVVYWVAAQLLPHPFPVIVLIVGVIVLLLMLVGESSSLNLDHR